MPILSYFLTIIKATILSSSLLATLAFGQQTQSQLLDRVARILAKPNALQVNFLQTKQIKGFKAPVMSSGQVRIARQRGMLWITDKPYQSTLKITANGITETRGGQVSQIGNPQSMKSVSSILSGTLAGDFSQLQRYFRFTGNSSTNSWSLKLTPIDANVARIISHIQMNGDRYINRIVINEANGDTSNIVFSGASAISISDTGL